MKEQVRKNRFTAIVLLAVVAIVCGVLCMGTIKSKAFAEERDYTAFTWKSVGVAAYTDDLMPAVFPEVKKNLTYHVPIEEAVECPGVFRLVYPYGERFEYNHDGDYDTDKNYYMIIDASDPEKVFLPHDQYTGLTWDDPAYVSSKAGKAISEGSSVSDTLYGKYSDGNITFSAGTLLAKKGLGSWTEANVSGKFLVHIHDFNYELSQDQTTITAKCTVGGCNLVQNKIAFTISAMTKNYDGYPADAGIDTTSRTAFSEATGKDLVIFYEGVQYLKTNLAPTDVGTYTASVTVSDGEKDYTAHKTFTVDKVDASVSVKPTGRSVYFDGTSQDLVIAGEAENGVLQYSMDADGPYGVSVPKARDAGRYIVYYKVFGDKNHKDTAPQSIVATINKKLMQESSIVAIPDQAYTGGPVTPEITVKDTNGILVRNEDYDVVYSDNVKAGRATVTVTFKKNYSGTVQTYFNIVAKKVPVPVRDETTFVYNREEQTYAVAENEFYTVTGNKRTNVGSQTVRIALKDKENYEWETGGSVDFEFIFEIFRKKIVLPTRDETIFVYTGLEQTYAVAENDFYTVTGNKRTNAGSQTVRIVLDDKDNLEWTTGGTTDVEYTFEIVRKKITAPVENDTVFYFTGEEQTYAVAESEFYTVTGNKRTSVGSQTVRVILNDKDNLEWTTGGTADFEFPFEIIKKVLTESNVAAISPVIYNGKPQTPALRVSDGKQTLVLGTDYTVQYSDNVNVTSQAKAAITFINNYEGSAEKYFTVSPMTVSIRWSKDSYAFNGTEQKIMAYYTDVIGTVINLAVETDRPFYEMGEYTATASFMNQETNYILPQVRTKVYHMKAAAYDMSGVTFPDVTVGYDGLPHVLSIKGQLPQGVTVDYQDNYNINAGTYTVTAQFTGDPNYATIDDMTATLVIEKAVVTSPKPDGREFVYNGTEQYYVLAENEKYVAYNTVRTNAGSQTVIVELTDKNNYCWTGGSSEDLSYLFTIARKKVNAPAADERKFVYNGQEQTYKIDISGYYRFSNTKRTVAGSQVVTVELLYPENYEWSTGSSENLTFTFLIHKAQINVPVADERSFVYTGEEQTYKIAESPYYAVHNDKRTLVGVQNVTVVLYDKENYEWTTGNTEDFAFPFEIRKKKVNAPVADERTFYYTGNEQTYNVVGSSYYDVLNNKRTAVGAQTVRVILRDKENYEWTTGGTEDFSFTFEIVRAKYDTKDITFPDVSVPYDGKVHNAFLKGELPQGVSVAYTGNGKIDVGVYTVTARFTVAEDNYQPIPDMTAKLEIMKTELSTPSGGDKPQVVYYGEGFPSDLVLKITVTKEAGDEERQKFGELLTERDVIQSVYRVALVRLVEGKEVEVLPSEIKPGAVLTLQLEIPDELKNKNFRLLHVAGGVSEEILSDPEAEVGKYHAEGGFITTKTGSLEEFAFVYRKAFPIWIIFAIVGVLLAGAGVFFVLWWRKKQMMAEEAEEIARQQQQVPYPQMTFKIPEEPKKEKFGEKKDDAGKNGENKDNGNKGKK